MFGSVIRQKICRPLRPEAQRREFLVRPDRFHDRDQFAGHERQRHERRRDDEAGDGEQDSEAVGPQPRAE